MKNKQKSLFKHPLNSGWLVPYLIPLDLMFTKRYEYYYKVVAKGDVVDEPIPRIDFTASPNDETVKNISDCLKFAECKGYPDILPEFVAWILWGLKSPHQNQFPSKVKEEISEYWYKTFNMGLLLKYPADYMMHFSSGGHLRGNKAKRASHHTANSYFPTPPHVAILMMQMVMGKEYSKKQAVESMDDPCGGTGIFSLAASNYCMNMTYTDIDHTLAQYARLNFHLYVPWMIYPCFLKGMKMMARNRTVVGNALLLETQEKFEFVRWKTQKKQNPKKKKEALNV